MEQNAIELPDYLPPKYSSWLDLYLDVMKQLRGHDVNDLTEISLVDMGYSYYDLSGRVSSDQEKVFFTQKFPLYVLKSRALEYLLEQIPSRRLMDSMRHLVFSHQSPIMHTELRQAIDQLTSVAEQIAHHKK